MERLGEIMRVAPQNISDLPWYLRPLFWLQKRRYGAALDSALVWARVPVLFTGVALLYGALDRKRSPLDPALRSLVTVRVSQVNGCAFCIDINSATLVRLGVPAAKIEALSQWRESSLFSETERLALEFAEAVTRTDGRVDDGLMGRLKGAFSDDQIVELTGLIAFQNMSSKFNSALAIPPQGFCRTFHNSAARLEGADRT